MDAHEFVFSTKWHAGKRLCGQCHLDYEQGNHIEVRVLEPYTSYVCPTGGGHGHSSRWSGSQGVPELRRSTDNLCICGETFVKEDDELWNLSWEYVDLWTGDWKPCSRTGSRYSTHEQHRGLLSMPEEIRNIKLVKA